MAMTLRSKRAKLLTDSLASNSKETSSLAVNDLPCEILLEVFSYLGQDQLLNTIPQVCKRWETLHSDHSLYKRSYIFTRQEPSKDVAIKLINNTANWLQSLKLESRNDTNAILKCVSKSNLCLETLVLRFCKGSPSGKPIFSVSLRLVLDRCKLLQHLSLEGSHCDDGTVYNEIGLQLPSLKSVDFGAPTRFDSQALLNIADKCLQLEEIRAVAFGGTIWVNSSITDHIVSSLCNQLQYLKSVELFFEHCTDESVLSLAKCLQLTNLRLVTATRITGVGLMAISDMPKIVKLELRTNHQISTSCWSDFFRKPIMKRLQKLTLCTCTNITEAQMIMIVNKPFELRELNLYSGGCLGLHYTLPQS